jgi:uncharacterized membrane protein
MKKLLKITLSLTAYIFVLAAILLAVHNNGLYPSGTSAMYHIYRGDWLFRSLSSDCLWPLYNSGWGGGSETLRYGSPFAAYIFALCEAAGLGNPFYGYLIFITLIYSLGVITWLTAGIKNGRPCFGVFTGILWFFMPNNLYTLFSAGSFPDALIFALLPLLIVFICDYITDGRTRSIIGLMAVYTVFILCSTGLALLTALVTGVFLILYILINYDTQHRLLDIVISFVLCFLISGIFLLPSSGGSLFSDGGLTSASAENLMHTPAAMLAPLLRLTSGGSALYLGVSVIILTVFGIITSHRREIPAFAVSAIMLTAAFISSGTDKSSTGRCNTILYLITAAACFTLFAFIHWKTLKKPFVVILCLLLIADAFPSYGLIYGDQTGLTPEKRLSAVENDTLIAEAKKITTQRLAFLGTDSKAASISYLTAGTDSGKASLFSTDISSAPVSERLSQLNTALCDGSYLYMFDSLLSMGADTVVIRKGDLYEHGLDNTLLTSSAGKLGYTLVDENGAYLLYHLKDSPACFGVTSRYDGISIGSDASEISRMFPSIEESASEYVDDYSLDDLSRYGIIYLDHFKYHDVTAAETLVTKLSQKGIRIIIFADGIPMNRKSRTQRFLDVECQPISFINGYPEFHTKKLGTISCDLFPPDASTWNTVYLNGLDNVLGTADDLDKHLAFYGTVKNDNIIMIGFNLTYFYSLTHDPTVADLLSGIVETPRDKTAEHSIIPLKIKYTSRSITVTSDTDNVNTGLAYHDIFHADSGKIWKRNYMTYVNKGTTEIRLQYPDLLTGLILSLAGLIISLFFLIQIHRSRYQVNPGTPPSST